MASEDPTRSTLAGASRGRAMTAAEFRVSTEWMGLRRKETGILLGVPERDAREWMSGRTPVPNTVRTRMEELERYTADTIEKLIARTEPGATLTVYRTDGELWAHHPEFRPLPVGWWWMVAARAAAAVPGVGIDYAQSWEEYHQGGPPTRLSYPR